MSTRTRDFCKNGHYLSETRRFNSSGSYCSICKRTRDRQKYERKPIIRNYENGYVPPKLIYPSKFKVLVESLKHVLRPEVPLDDFSIWMRFYATEFNYVK